MTLYEQLANTSNLRHAWRLIHKRPQSAGVDEVSISDFRDRLETELDKLRDNLQSKKYRPKRLKGHPLEKGKNTARITDSKEYRILKIPTVRDRVVQKSIEQLIGNELEKKYELNNGVSFAYIKGGSVEKAALKVREYYSQGNGWYYKADIKGFFDNINKDELLKMIRAALPDETLMPLIEDFLKIDIANAKDLQKVTKKRYEYDPLVGVAQGSPLSPLFANVFLSSLDQLAKKKKLNMVRYADDLVVLTKDKDSAIAAHDIIDAHLKELDLELHELLVKGDLPKKGHIKHSIVSTYSGMSFLGLMFKGSKIYPSGKSFDNAIWTVRRAANNKSLPLVKKLISIEARIQGWCSAYAFTDYKKESIDRIDKLLEDVMSKVLRKSDLKQIHGKTALQALGMATYQSRLDSIREKRANKK